jgi:hypothetical protein
MGVSIWSWYSRYFKSYAIHGDCGLCIGGFDCSNMHMVSHLKKGRNALLIISQKKRFLTNRYLRTNTNQAGDQQVEWAYAFDIHCNSFFPLFLMLYILQFFIFPIITRHNIVSLTVGNFIYFVSIVWYIYGTFLGFNGKFFFYMIWEGKKKK